MDLTQTSNAQLSSSASPLHSKGRRGKRCTGLDNSLAAFLPHWAKAEKAAHADATKTASSDLQRIILPHCTSKHLHVESDKGSGMEKADEGEQYGNIADSPANYVGDSAGSRDDQFPSLSASAPSLLPSPQLKFTKDLIHSSLIVHETSVGGDDGCKVVTRRRSKGQCDVRVVYSREFLLNASKSPIALMPPTQIASMLVHTPEVIAKFPKRFAVSHLDDFPSPPSFASF